MSIDADFKKSTVKMYYNNCIKHFPATRAHKLLFIGEIDIYNFMVINCR